MKRRTVLGLPLFLPAAATLTPALAVAQPSRWSPDRANRWYAAQGWRVGANYITSNAVNQLEMFQADTFDPRRINVELGWARAFGFNTVRVFLHDLLWAQDAPGFQYRLAQFVAIAARNRIKPMFVFFDSCWNPWPQPGRQPPPTPGVHNSRWVQSPGAERLDNHRYLPVLRNYVIGVMTQFRYDSRVLGWDLWNEPDNPAHEYASVERPDKLDRVAELLPQVFVWARSVDAQQPITSGIWEGSPVGSVIVDTQLGNSDVISFHSYDTPALFTARINDLSIFGRPILCTEYLARTRGNTIDAILPIMKRYNVSAYNWGFVAGKTQTYLPWDSWEHPYQTVPKVWFHDLLHGNGRPYRAIEPLLISNFTNR